ncbi:hypothetical protein [Burkholderia cenocepacia]|uniref:hypothetical protein n=1 Tax=Burkholderia cenocepacia TaxID=95486 RepID=UPI00076110A9|nr:hypothetical protein [Burkholderia cenocepacia]KWU26338.1 hypothetical protein AS149_25450 [Burkholderia cenocepacia]
MVVVMVKMSAKPKERGLDLREKESLDGRVMSAVRFAPWIGARYLDEGFRGLRVLLLAESHYGRKHSERPRITSEIVKALAMGGKHPRASRRIGWHAHYAKMLTAMHDRTSAAGFGASLRITFWEQVAYFNVIQQLMPPGRRKPAPDVWNRAMVALDEVLRVLQPHLVVCFSKRAGEHVRERVGTTPLVVVNHPSSGFEYALVNPPIRRLLDSVRAHSDGPNLNEFLKTPVFDKWRELSRVAVPAHGPHLDKADMAAVHLGWARDMAKLDRGAAGAPVAPGVTDQATGADGSLRG